MQSIDQEPLFLAVVDLLKLLEANGASITTNLLLNCFANAYGVILHAHYVVHVCVCVPS